MLRRSRLTALTRSDVVNRVIEIELPRYAVKPWDRFQNQEEYWGLSRHPSSIPGGSWTTFNWKTNTIGIKTQRVEYADQVRQPQVDIAFDDLVCYLLDLGAVPDAHGWKLLRSTGLWTPVGCSLMMSPNGRDKALTVGPQDDADGNLSLVVNWSSTWTTRDHVHLPPYWIRLPAQVNAKVRAKTTDHGESVHKNSEDTADNHININAQDVRPDSSSETSAGHNASTIVGTDITCQILTTGIVNAFSEGDLYSSTSSTSYSIEHIRVQPGLTDGIWFASVATAYGTTSQTVLWNYKIPDDILIFSRKESVPCGVMVLLGIVNDSETPDWCTANDHSGSSSHERFIKNVREQSLAIAAESRMAPAQREAAVKDRVQREMEQRMQDSKHHLQKTKKTIY